MSLCAEPLRLTLEGAPRALLLQVTEAREAETLDVTLDHLRGAAAGWAHAALLVDDWDADLSPWPAPAVFGDRPFGGGAGATLDALTAALPAIGAALRDRGAREDLPVILGGYSLAGLFALWAGYLSDRFAAVAAASPSVWFSGWDDFADARVPRLRAASLSLGRKEPRTRNRQMATVGEAILRQQARFEAAGIPCPMEWNEGNHFTEPERRTALCFARALDCLETEDDT